jgi:hypothetical protein
MEAMAVLGFIFGSGAFLFGLVAFFRVEKLMKTLKEKGLLDEAYKEDD